jgi:hypothetical protein
MGKAGPKRQSGGKIRQNIHNKNLEQKKWRKQQRNEKRNKNLTQVRKYPSEEIQKLRSKYL